MHFQRREGKSFAVFELLMRVYACVESRSGVRD